MTPVRTRITSRRVALALASAVLVAGMAGCAAPADTGRDARSSATPTAVKTPTPGPTIRTEATLDADEVTCAAFGDVLTIVNNAMVASVEGRMSEEELSRWYSLASRTLGTIPAAEEGTVAEALAALRSAVPAVPNVEPSDVDTDEFLALGAALREACKAAGFEVVSIGFTGG